KAKKLLNDINRHLQPPMQEHALEQSVLFINRNAEPMIKDIQSTLNWFQKQEMVKGKIEVESVMHLEPLKRINSIRRK
ncbi:MAG: hypothetical protein ACPG5T_00080, partial [Endozoicomonas sp.]